MIISASRRTDIPAFFPEWFMNRIRDGYFHRLNPFNAHQFRRISLRPSDVDVIVFWTKNPKPLLKYLPELDERGYRYYFQFTLNNYDALFEPNVPSLSERTDTFLRLSEYVGPSRVIWRYDPIILSKVTSVQFHIESISKIACDLNGATNQLIFSFLDFYGKVNKRIKELQRQFDINIRDIADDNHRPELTELLTHLQHVSLQHGIKALSCAEGLEMSNYGIFHGSCIDGELIRVLLDKPKCFMKDKNQRGACQCVESIDMGMYNTCNFKCAYCYANTSDQGIKMNLARHEITSASIIGNFGGVKKEVPFSEDSVCQQGELF